QWNERHADQMLQTLRAATADGTLVFPGGAQTPATFVDIGCADGRKTGALARAFSLPPESAIGLDIVKANKVAENIKFMEMLPNVLPDAIKPDSQDLAAISMVLHHSDDPGALLRSVHTALKPGSFVVICEHNGGDCTLHGYL